MDQKHRPMMSKEMEDDGDNEMDAEDAEEEEQGMFARDSKSSFDSKRMASITKRWVDWYTRQKGFRVIVYQRKTNQLSPGDLFRLMSDPDNGLCLSTVPLEPDNPKSRFDLVPGALFLQDLIDPQTDEWKYPDTEVILAQTSVRTVDPNTQEERITPRILVIAIAHRYDVRAYSAESQIHGPPENISPIFY